jgi:hypothetical protein
MQFSLPILPFDPSVAKAGANAASSSRLSDPNAAPAGANFGDLLPADARSNFKSGLADKSSLGLGVSKRAVPSDDDAAPADTEVTADENEQPAAKDSSENWFIANGFAQRFVTTTPNPATPTVNTGEMTGNAEEGSDAISENAGGKAMGLTQPMPATAQGDGRARAILNRAERKPFVVASATEQPVPPTASNPVPPATESASAAPTAPNVAATAPTEISEEPIAGTTPQIAPVADNSNLPVTNEVNADETPASETTVSARVSNQSEPISADDLSTGTTEEDANVIADSTDGTISPESFTTPVEFTAMPTPATATVEPQPGVPLTVDQPEAAVAPIQTASVAANAESTGEATSVDSTVTGKGVPSGKAFPLADSGKFSTAPGLANAAEKFAAGFERRRGISTNRGNSTEIKPLSYDKESVAQAQFGFGINVAKTQLAMAATATTSDLPSSLTPSMTADAVSAASALSHQAKDESQAGSSVSAARRAVESAIAIAEHFTGAEHRGVNLQFSVSGVDLAVRVELRGDAVHTTFRTDSPELRAALAHEWQVVNSQSSERPVRLADPVFASNSNGSATQSDTHSSQQRESASRGQFSADQFPGFRSSSRGSQSSAVATTTAAVVHESVSTSGRLRTFA